MKILCETQVVNRQTKQPRSGRVIKATVAVGYNPKIKDGIKSKDLEIIHFTPQNKGGTRYKVQDNIEKIFNRFVQDGKTTISFRQPPDDLMIRCDPIQLKGFLQTLKLGLEGKQSMNFMGNVVHTTAIPQKAQPQTKMVVAHRKDYPLKGFPKSLLSLRISSIQLERVTFQVCSLRNLTSLDLSNNKIRWLPPELGRLSLRSLIVNENYLGAMNAWQWLDKKEIQKSLRELDMSVNSLTHFPRSLVKLESLVTLKLNYNAIPLVPFSVRRMTNLRFLHLACNQLTSLPSVFNDTRLDILDIWCNQFEPLIEYPNIAFDATHSVPPLWLMASRAVSRYKLSYSQGTLPQTLVTFLSEAPKCACNNLVAGGTVLKRAAMATFENVQNLTFSRERHIYADIILCGPQCAGRKQVL